MKRSVAGHNVEAIIRHSTEYIHGQIADAKRTGLASLTAYRQIGAALKITKEAMSGVCGSFGKWAQDNFGFSKQWRTRLMRLDTEWANFGIARAWAEVEGTLTGGREFSVDGALALIERWRCATQPGYASSKRRNRRASSESAAVDEPTAASGETEVERLRRLLKAEKQRNSVLTREIAALKTGSAGRRPPNIDPQITARASKVAELWVRGGTHGEREAAKERLRNMADQLDIGFPTFVRACRITTPPDYPFAQAA